MQTKSLWVAALLLTGLLIAGCGGSPSGGLTDTDYGSDSPAYDLEPDAGVSSSGCDSNYSGCVPMVDYDLDCSDVRGPLRVHGADVHGFDRDGDGVGCESG